MQRRRTFPAAALLLGGLLGGPAFSGPVVRILRLEVSDVAAYHEALEEGRRRMRALGISPRMQLDVPADPGSTGAVRLLIEYPDRSVREDWSRRLATDEPYLEWAASLDGLRPVLGDEERELGGLIPILDATGEYHRPVSTPSLWAQRYFDQGLRLYYEQRLEESVASFRESAAADPECPSAWWGLALALMARAGGLDDEAASREAVEPIRRAAALRDRASAVERALIDALFASISDAPITQPASNPDRRTAALRAVWQAFPDDPDVATLYAEARIRSGAPAEDTAAVLDHVLEADPDHPGARRLRE